ncbi:MAG TPA: hypothetical protein VNA12_05540 [Mycobacteriales bacterium]|nr:hypothetical protein [Mycobacteriales bacterium]
MAVSRDDFQLMLQIEQTFKPSRAAKMFCWSDAVQIGGHEFFDRYGWASDERMHVNEYATFFEMCALAWRRGFVDDELINEWVGAVMPWSKIGHLLLAAREILGDDELWAGFEALAKAQQPPG